MSAALGIDVGSSTCCAYLVKDGELRPVPDAASASTTPAWVAFTHDRVLVGEDARRQAATNPHHTAFGIARLLGRKFYASETVWLRDAIPVGLVPAPNGDAWFHIGGHARSPQELLSYLLADVRDRAELIAGEPLEAVVLCTAASADERQRRALLEAAALADIAPLRLLHAPTATAIACAHDNPAASGRWAVLDLGSGCFDASVIEVGPRRLEVLATVGDPLLGGDDFDRKIAELLVDAFYEEHGVDLGNDPAAVHRLFEVARIAKRELSQSARSSTIHVPLIAQRGDTLLDLHHPGLERAAFEELVDEELTRLAEPCALVLDDLGFGTDDMSAVILVGGMARVPVVQERVSYLFRTRPTVPMREAELPAIGAALYAASRAGQHPGLLLDELTPHSIGIKIRGGRMSPVIHRRAIVPCREQKVFATVKSGSANVMFEVYEGEGELATENVYLGRFAAVPPPGTSQLVVAFNLDESGLLGVEVGAGPKATPVTLHASRGLTDEELAELKRERAGRSCITSRPDPHLGHEPPKGPTLSSTPPPSDERSRSLRPGPRRSVPPPAPGPRPPARRSTAPTAFANAKTRASLGPDSSGAAIEVAGDSMVGTVVGGRYVIEDIIADGGMGRVYLARHLMLDKKFALKVLHAELAQNDELAARFVREAQAAARIDSPHVVGISDFGRLPDGNGYFVMEYLPGTTLAQLLQERGALPAKLIIDVAMQLTDALTVAHGLGIVHRDLKPDNVTLIQRGGHPYFCKILDFGIAKAPTSDSPSRQTLAGTLLGTPHYMAPEQIDGADVDGRCDIYSLGALMYEMATGRPPFQSETLVGVLVAHKTEAPVPVRSHAVAAQCPLELQAIIHRCLAKLPADRYPSAEALHEALAAIP